MHPNHQTASPPVPDTTSRTTPSPAVAPPEATAVQPSGEPEQEAVSDSFRVELPLDGEGVDEGEDWDEDEVGSEDLITDEAADPVVTEARTTRVRRRRRQLKLDSPELRLRGRRALCKRIEDIAPYMLKMVKQRILNNFLPSLRGLEDDDLTRVLREDAVKLAERSRILSAVTAHDADFNRGQLKAMILHVLLQEETYSLPENRLDEKVIEFEKVLVKRSKTLDLSELRKEDPDRWHHYDTYRIVLDAAWSNDNVISPDEARLLGVLRAHLRISWEEHWLISALLKRFPKEGCALHTADEVNEARKELHRQGLVWGYSDEDNQKIDVIPAEIAAVIRRDYAGLELQSVNYRRLMSHDNILLTDLRDVLQRRGLDRTGNKAELIERVVASDVKPSEVLDDLDREKLSAICGSFGLKSSGTKAELIGRLVEFYDDLTFEERVSKDEREAWYSDYELLAGRAYAELRAKKVITKDLDIQYLFEDATEFLFEMRLRAACDRSRKENRADGRLRLDYDQCLLWDCKSVEVAVNLQDYLETQFDGYLRKERETGKQPLGFLVIGPAFTPQSISLANKYKARTNWDIALVLAAALKHLADRWTAIAPDRTELIDRERAESLLSLA
jgi:hypothetical protein